MAILSNGVEEDKRKKTQESELIGDSAWNGNSAWMDLLFRKGIIGISMYFMERHGIYHVGLCKKK